MSRESGLSELSIAEAGKLLRAGELTSTELTEHSLSRIVERDLHIHSFILVTRERALSDAARADCELRQGIDRGPLHGIPYGLKDIYCTGGIPTTCNSRLLQDNVPSEDCFVEQKLREGGAVLLGKLATHEFAIGGPSFDLPWPVPRNPWNTDHITGGSSSGSGAAVAAGFLRMAMGTDTAGSIRSPSAHCGVVGVKPTYGRVSRRGVYPLSYTLDHCGPLAWTVEDAALALQVVAGFDRCDPASADVPALEFTSGIGDDLKGLKIAYARDLFSSSKNALPELVDAIDNAAKKLEDLGAIIEEVQLPSFDLFSASGFTIMRAEAFAVHQENLRNRPHDYGRFAYQRIMPGLAILGSDYVQAMRLRRELARTVNLQVLDKYQAIVTASAFGPAPRLDSFGPDAPSRGGTQSIMFNVTGNPTLCIPIAFASNGLPLGMQIAGRPFDERTIFRIGAKFQAETRDVSRRPILARSPP